MTEAALSPVPQPLAPSGAVGRLFAFVRRLVREKPLGAAGGAIFLVFLFCGIFADFLAPYGMNETNLEVRLEAPSLAHPLGTDHLGRDVLSRILIGAKLSMIVSFLAAGIGTLVSLVIGVLSGYLGGKTDMILQPGTRHTNIPSHSPSRRCLTCIADRADCACHGGCAASRCRHLDCGRRQQRFGRRVNLHSARGVSPGRRSARCVR